MNKNKGFVFRGVRRLPGGKTKEETEMLTKKKLDKKIEALRAEMKAQLEKLKAQMDAVASHCGKCDFGE